MNVLSLFDGVGINDAGYVTDPRISEVLKTRYA